MGVLILNIGKKDEFAILKMSSSDMLQTAMAMNGIGGIELNARSFEIIEQPTPTVNKFGFVSELLKKPEQNKPLHERLQLITKKNDGTIYGQSSRKSQGKSYQKIRIHSGGFRGMAEIMISAVETKEDCSVHPHVIVGGENVATGPMFVKRVKIEKDSTDVDIRVAIVSTKKGDETQNTMELIRSIHEEYALNDKGLIYKILQPERKDHKYDLNAVRLRFQVKFIEGEGIQDFLPPVISNPIRIGTLEIKEISDDTAPIQGGKKIIIVCHKLKLKKNEKIIPEFCYLDETKNIWFTVRSDEASLKSYEGVAISLKTPQIFQNHSSSVKAELYLTREVNGKPVERSEGEEFTFINDLPELGSISSILNPTEEPNNRRNHKRPSDEPGPRTAEGNNKVGHRTTSTVVQQENNATLAIDALNSDAFLKTMILNPPVDNSPVDNPLPPPPVDASQNNTQHEVTQELPSSDIPRCLTEPQSPFSPEQGMRSDGNDPMVGGLEEAVSSMESVNLEK